jgi:hypothetical protein
MPAVGTQPCDVRILDGRSHIRVKTKKTKLIFSRCHTFQPSGVYISLALLCFAMINTARQAIKTLTYTLQHLTILTQFDLQTRETFPHVEYENPAYILFLLCLPCFGFVCVCVCVYGVCGVCV